MAGEGREKVRINALLRAEDRELSQAMARARTRTRQQVAQVARATRAQGGGARLRAAWVKPPTAHVVRAVGRVIGGAIGPAIRGGARMVACGARAVGNRDGVSFHFTMGQTYPRRYFSDEGFAHWASSYSGFYDCPEVIPVETCCRRPGTQFFLRSNGLASGSTRQGEHRNPIGERLALPPRFTLARAVAMPCKFVR